MKQSVTALALGIGVFAAATIVLFSPPLWVINVSLVLIAVAALTLCAQLRRSVKARNATSDALQTYDDFYLGRKPGPRAEIHSAQGSVSNADPSALGPPSTGT